MLTFIHTNINISSTSICGRQLFGMGEQILCSTGIYNSRSSLTSNHRCSFLVGAALQLAHWESGGGGSVVAPIDDFFTSHAIATAAPPESSPLNTTFSLGS